MKNLLLVSALLLLIGCETNEQNANLLLNSGSNENVTTTQLDSTASSASQWVSEETPPPQFTRTANTPLYTSKAPEFALRLNSALLYITAESIINAGTAVIEEWEITPGIGEIDYIVKPKIIKKPGTIIPQIKEVDEALPALYAATSAELSPEPSSNTFSTSQTAIFEFFKFRNGHAFDGHSNFYYSSTPSTNAMTTTFYDFTGDIILRWGPYVNASSYPDPSEAIFDITSSRTHECYVNTSGNVYCRGSNLWGELGIGYSSNPGLSEFDLTKPVVDANSIPLANIISIKSRGTVSSSPLYRNATNIALSATGNVFSWGYNLWTELGTEISVTGYCTPSYPCSAKAVAVLDESQNPITTATEITNNCALLAVGEVVCWGLNNHVSGPKGSVGNGSNDVNSDFASYVVNELGARLTNIASIAGAGHSNCALTTTGVVYCWGNNEYGQLGNGTMDTNVHNAAEQIPGLTIVNSITGSGTGYSNDQTSPGAFCVTLNDTTVRCWGYGVYNNLGDGNSQSSHTPVLVLESDSSPFTGAIKTTVGLKATCAVVTDFSTKCWGINIGAGGAIAPHPTTFIFF